jgi:signal transduction histidine kinase
VNIDFEAGQVLSVIISDNGRGLTITGDDERDGNGLRNMQRRIESVKGSFTIANDNGVVVSITVPLQE